jgi:hypothetical protein
MRAATTLGLFLLASACSSAPAWEPIPKPWTSVVIDVQRRVRVVPVEGATFEVERPLYEPEGKHVLAWRGAGPDERFPTRSLPLDQVTDLLSISSGDIGYGGQRMAQAGLVAAGVILWGLLIVAIFV